MSPTLVLPPPFRRRELPPYGHADWKRVQPELLRRSLAISSAAALAFGLLLGLVLQRVSLPPPEVPVIVEVPHHIDDVKPFEEQAGPRVPPPANPRFGIPIPEPDAPETADPAPTQEPDPGKTDPFGSLGGGGTGLDANRAVTMAPERPDPKQVVVLDDLPREVYSPKPEYPELARQAQMEGTVILRVLVNREGNVQEVILERSSPVFDEAAEKAIRQWRFRPGILDHVPVAAWVTIPVRFVLNE